ncbi:zinc finger protein 227-like isoform X2 [Gouania willdenowi]|uniref:zinc finger protein 227-like isoform X2 n=1 Tax=Gouania willdenowi TaxID=441366 RepID=UPI001056966F|nr:zinc finger protein 227-like isoform X2 [Gouania willdenowi]
MNTVDYRPQEKSRCVYKPNEADRGNTAGNPTWGHDPKVHPELLCVKEEEDNLWMVPEAEDNDMNRLQFTVTTVKSEDEEGITGSNEDTYLSRHRIPDGQHEDVLKMCMKEEEQDNLWIREDDDVKRLQFTVTTVKSEDEEDEEGKTGSNEDTYLSRHRKPEGQHEDVLKMFVKEEEQDNLWIREDDDVKRLQFTVTTVKSEDEEKPPLQRQDEEGKEKQEDAGADSDSSNPEVSVSEWQKPMRGLDPQPEGGYSKMGVSSNAPKKFFSCSNCGKHFNHKQSLQRHIRRNSDSGSSRGFIMLGCVRLKPNTDSHTGEKLFNCDVCGKRIKYRHNLKTHMRVHTGEKSYGCDVCGQRFAHQQNLKTHKRTHTGEKPFVCQVCGKNVRNLKIHQQVHTGEKPFSCSDCGKSFKRKAHLATHMTVHKGERPFGCELCTKRFYRKGHLRAHMIVHSGEKPFSCDLCGKKFNRKTHLDTHFAIHTGERPYGCAICGQEFTQLGSLNRHMTFHLG